MNNTTQNDLERKLAAAEGAAWKISPAPGERRSVRWVPVLSLKEALPIGVNSQGGWVAETAEGVVAFAPEGPLHLLFPLLEKSRAKGDALLAASLRKAGLPASLVQTFPRQAVVVYALSCGGHWAEVVVEALEAEVRLEEAYRQPLTDLMADKKKTTQNLRLRIRRVLEKRPPKR